MLAQVALLTAPAPHRRIDRLISTAPTAAWWQRPGRHSTVRVPVRRRRCHPAGAPPKVAVAAAYSQGPSKRQAPQEEPDEEPPRVLRKLLQLVLTVLLAPFLLLANLLLADPPELPDTMPGDRPLTLFGELAGTLAGWLVEIVFKMVTTAVVFVGGACLTLLQAPPRVEAAASWLTGGSRVAEVLAACSMLPLLPSPAMTLAAILLIFVHYKALYWFHYWHARTFPAPMTHGTAAEEARGPVMRGLHWLFDSPRGQALYWIILMYGGIGMYAGRLFVNVLTGYAYTALLGNG